jgi:hypothetical protein
VFCVEPQQVFNCGLGTEHSSVSNVLHAVALHKEALMTKQHPCDSVTTNFSAICKVVAIKIMIMIEEKSYPQRSTGTSARE